MDTARCSPRSVIYKDYREVIVFVHASNSAPVLVSVGRVGHEQVEISESLGFYWCWIGLEAHHFSYFAITRHVTI